MMMQTDDWLDCFDLPVSGIGKEMYRPHESYLKCTDKPGIVLVLLYSV
jgi:hypothetical protein